MKNNPLFFYKRFDLSKPLNKFNPMLIQHIFMQEERKLIIYPPLPPSTHEESSEALSSTSRKNKAFNPNSSQLAKP
jgi:hypothetical protein